MMRNKISVLVTGAIGSAGQHTTQALEEDSFLSFEILKTAYPDKPDSSGPVCFYSGLHTERHVFRNVNEIRPDWVIHFAAISNVRRSWQKRAEMMEASFMGSQNLLEVIRLESPATRTLFIGSSRICGCGGSPNEALAEDASLEIKSPYA